MAVQRVIPEDADSRVASRNSPPVRQRPVPTPREPSIAEQIELLPDDFHRAVFCRQHAEEYRRKWFEGRQREIDYVLHRAEVRDPRFRNMSHAHLVMTAQWRWSQSATAQYLFALESTFTGWARMYLSFAEVQALSRHAPPPS